MDDFIGFIKLMKQLAIWTAGEREFLKRNMNILEDQSKCIWEMVKFIDCDEYKNKEALVTTTPQHELKVTWKDVLSGKKSSEKSPEKTVIGIAKEFEEVVKIKSDEKQEKDAKKMEDSSDLEQEDYMSWIKEIVSDQEESQETDLFLPKMHAKALKLTRIYKALLEKLVNSLLGYNNMPYRFKEFKNDLDGYIKKFSDTEGDFIVQLISVLVERIDDLENVTPDEAADPAAYFILNVFYKYALLLDWTLRVVNTQEEKEKGLHDLRECITAAMRGRE